MILSKFLIPLSLIAILLAPIGLQSSFVVAEEQSGNVKEVAEYLMNSLENTINVVNQTFNSLKAQGAEISEDAIIHYEKGLELADKAKELFDQERYSDSIEATLVALRHLKIALTKVSQKVVGEDEREVGLQVAANRTLVFIARIEEVVNEAKVNGYDVSKVNELIDEAKIKIENVTKLVSEDKVNEAAEELGKARRIIESAIHELHELIKPERIKQAKNFVEKFRKHLELRKSKIEKLPIPDEVKQKILSAIEEAENKLIEAGKELNINGLHKAIPKLVLVGKIYKKADEKISEAKKNVKNMLVREVESLEKTIERLEERIEKTKVKIANLEEVKGKISEAKKLLEDAKELIENDDIEGASEKIAEIKQILHDIMEMLAVNAKKSK